MPAMTNGYEGAQSMPLVFGGGAEEAECRLGRIDNVGGPGAARSSSYNLFGNY
jgi:hypothetical protein